MMSDEKSGEFDKLCKKYSPILIFHENEPWRPVEADCFLRNSLLIEDFNQKEWEEVVLYNRKMKLDELKPVLKDVKAILEDPEKARRYLKGDKTKNSQLVFYKFDPTLDIVKRKGKTRNNLRDLQAEFLKKNKASIYCHYAHSKEYLSLAYYFFYLGNDIPLKKEPRKYDPFYSHDCDWEMIRIYFEHKLDEDTNKKKWEPQRIQYSQHYPHDRSPDPEIQWTDLDKNLQIICKTHPLIWVALGGHASFPYKEDLKERQPILLGTSQVTEFGGGTLLGLLIPLLKDPISVFKGKLSDLQKHSAYNIRAKDVSDNPFFPDETIIPIKELEYAPDALRKKCKRYKLIILNNEPQKWLEFRGVWGEGGKTPKERLSLQRFLSKFFLGIYGPRGPMEFLGKRKWDYSGNPKEKDYEFLFIEGNEYLSIHDYSNAVNKFQRAIIETRGAIDTLHRDEILMKSYTALGITYFLAYEFRASKQNFLLSIEKLEELHKYEYALEMHKNEFFIISYAFSCLSLAKIIVIHECGTEEEAKKLFNKLDRFREISEVKELIKEYYPIFEIEWLWVKSWYETKQDNYIRARNLLNHAKYLAVRSYQGNLAIIFCNIGIINLEIKQGNHEKAQPYIDENDELFQALKTDPPDQTSQLSVNQDLYYQINQYYFASVQYFRGNFKETIKLIDPVVNAFKNLDDEYWINRAEILRYRSNFYLGEWEKSYQAHNETRKYYEDRGITDSYYYISLLLNLTEFERKRGNLPNYYENLALCEENIENMDAGLKVYYLIEVSEFNVENSSFQTAYDTLHEAGKLCKIFSFTRPLIRILNLIELINLKTVDLKLDDEYLDLFGPDDNPTSLSEKLNNKYRMGKTKWTLAVTSIKSNNFSEAEGFLSESTEIFDEIGYLEGIAENLLISGYLESRKNESIAINKTKESLKLFKKLGFKYGIARSQFQLGCLENSLNDDNGIEHIREAKNLFESLNNEEGVAKTLFIEGLWLLNKQPQSDGYKKLTESMDMFSKIKNLLMPKMIRDIIGSKHPFSTKKAFRIFLPPI